MSDNLRAIAESRVERKIKFKRNLYSYIVVNVILAIVNIIFTPEYWWFLWVVLFWGIGVLVDFLRAYVLMDKFDTDEYRERKIQEEMDEDLELEIKQN